MVNLRNAEIDKLFEAILGLKDVDECYRFFDDVCTIKEINDIAQRLQVALMLNKGKSYQEVSKETGASTATISRVSRCLVYGSGGYKEVISKLEKGDLENESK